MDDAELITACVLILDAVALFLVLAWGLSKWVRKRKRSAELPPILSAAPITDKTSETGL